jgi:hypothetical protein
MNLADFLRQGPLTQQRMADASAFDRDSELANMMRQHGTVSQQPSALDRSGDIASNLFYGDTVPPKDESILDPQYIPMKGAPQKYDGVGMDLVMPAITAWHGSPHKFSKFDMSKIGTGEGAQAYGHGLYMAENPNVAKDYQKKLASRDFENPDGSVFDPFEHLVNRNVRATLQKTDGDVKATIDRANELIKSIPGTQGAEYAQKDIDVLSKLQGLKRSEGNLYKVDIPDKAIAKMLDWDKPLSGQSQEVRDLYKNPFEHYEAGKGQGSRPWGLYDKESGFLDTEMPFFYTEQEALSFLDDPVGSKIYELLAWGSHGANAKNVSADLLDAGIPGIKYLDQGSRQGGKGTSNFVLFADDIAKILERNDQPIGELAEMLSSGKKVKP